MKTIGLFLSLLHEITSMLSQKQPEGGQEDDMDDMEFSGEGGPNKRASSDRAHHQPHHNEQKQYKEEVQKQLAAYGGQYQDEDEDDEDDIMNDPLLPESYKKNLQQQKNQ